ncbi:hypothetical protein TKK_0006842 [Trichogramma kaykai]|uniref:Centromere protein L n=1 Tax=Trichogramma kaykai TaxID=54128 RepID=A0ABD2XBD7_9HYME
MRRKIDDVVMENNSESESSRSGSSGALSRPAGVRESRKQFNLAAVRKAPDFAAGGDNGENLDPLLDLEVLLRQTWNICGVSTLFNFQCENEVVLKQYAKKLREQVACMLSQEDVSYEAKVSVLELERPNSDDHPIIKINVTAKVATKGDRETMVYSGYLISWGNENVENSFTDNATKLPLLLCRGTPNTMKAVHATLSRLFDCIIVTLPANSEDLAWLLPIIISPGCGQDSAKDADEASLEYRIPNLPTSESITIKFQIKNLQNLLKSFLSDEDKINAHEVHKFHEIIQHQILEVSSLQLGLCILHRISLPCVTISGSKMKVTNVQAMNAVLTYLNEKAMDALHCHVAQLSICK